MQTTPSTDAREEQHWTCPFCPLLCDDIVIDASAQPCPRLRDALTHFSDQDTNRRPEIDAQATDFSSALSAAATILGQAKRPLFGGLATDIAGARALYELAATHGAILDHLHGDALAAGTLEMQDRGAFFTTLSEIRSRADLVIVFASDPSRRYPRFYERAVGTGANIIHMGCETTDSLLKDADPFDILALWSALIETGRTHLSDELAALSKRIEAAQYTAFIYEPAALPQPHAALAIEALHRIVKAFNRTVRAGALALTGDDGALSVNQTMTWLSGFPLRTRVAYGKPLDHDAHRYRTESLLKHRHVDALLWVSSFAPEALPASLDDEMPVVVLGHAQTPALERKGPTVFIPVATPAMDHNAHLFRVDTSVVAPLNAARKTSLPSVAQVVVELTKQRRPS